MSNEIEKNVDSIKSDIGCLTWIILIGAMVIFAQTVNHGNIPALLAKQNEIMKQILHYQEQSK